VPQREECGKSYQQSGKKWNKVAKSGFKSFIFTNLIRKRKMTTFIGDYVCKVDPKGRIMLPSAFKRQMPEGASNVFVVKKDIYEKCLVFYTLDEWQRQNELIKANLNPYNKEHNLFLRNFFKGAAEVELDTSNRLLIPRRLLDEANIDKDSVLLGQGSKIEMWSKEMYEKIGTEDDFATLAEKVMGSVNKTL
jgi:MraZ protein